MRILRITGYTSPVERQLKERLIGAAVLVAIAVLLVPEMFSGPRSRSPLPVELDSRAGTSEAATEQIKTMQIDLQRAPVGASDSAARSSEAASSTEPVTVEPPAPAPRSDIAQAAADPVPVPAETQRSDGSRAASSAVSQAVSAPPVPTQSAAKSSTSSRAASSAAASSAPSKPAAAPAGNWPSGNWAVQIGSFGTEARAREIAANLKSQGYSVSVSPLKAGGKTLFRVRVAGGGTQDSAQAVLKKLSATYGGAAVVPPGK